MKQASHVKVKDFHDFEGDGPAQYSFLRTQMVKKFEATKVHYLRPPVSLTT